ncbi:MAG: GNAT family N-acetyltransferase [Tepidisphaeraceae bacterium]
MGQLSDPALVELSADATWPAEENEPLGPWRLRATRGYSHRANSVRTVCAEGGGPVHVSWLELITEAEAFYRQRHLPAIFHISPATAPGDLDRLLDERGYDLGHSAEVWSADPGEVRDATERGGALGQIVERNSPDAAWLACAWDEHIGPGNVREEICRRVPSPRVFAVVVEGNEPVARVLGTVHGGVGWVYCMASVPDRQRRGHATRLLNSLAQWTLASGGKTLCLQVMAENTPARKLYAKATFRKQYDYHYRVRR